MASNPKVLATTTVEPAFEKSTEEAIAYAERWLSHQPERFRRKALRVFQYAQIDRRFSVRDPESLLYAVSFEDRNDQFIEQSIALGERALVMALEKANLQPTDIDFFITVSCTGFMIPSLDAFLINSLRMRQDVVRLPVTEMGCAAGVSALIYAKNLLAANPGKRAVILAAEFPSCTFQVDDFSMANVVSAALFGDGVACAILGPDADKPGFELGSFGMYHFYDAIPMMGYKVTNSGFQMILDPHVPETIVAHMPEVLDGFLAMHGLAIPDIEHFIFHPGGKKIIQVVEEKLEQAGKHIEATKAVLRNFGNMSSATVLYVLDHILKQPVAQGDLGLVLSFGPGFSAQRMLLKWA